MKVFVAGHRGLVGAALCRRLAADGHGRVLTRTRAELDLRRQADTEAFFAAERPDVVFLAAGRVGGILPNSTRPADFIADNLAIALNVIEAAHRSGVAKLLNLGSSCIYPRLAPQPIREADFLSGPLEPTNQAYAVAKIAAIQLCASFNAQHGTRFLSLMPTNLYGPGDNYDLETAHVLPALIRKFTLAAGLAAGDADGVLRDLERRPPDAWASLTPAERGFRAAESLLAAFGVTAERVTLWGTGTPRREFLHVDDLARACVTVVDRFEPADTGLFLNVGTGEDHTIRELAERVREAAGFNGEIAFDASKPDGMPRKLLDVSRIRALGWAPRVPLEAGIRRTVAAYREEVAGCRP
ncbi:MAG: GDP-L-fucose synthase [Acidobacteria bacterium]|nr:GDP-L-fucose synthase [Acidobacteriota bacterium]